MTSTHPAARRPATVRVARWSATHPWRAIALWLVFLASCIAIGQAAGLHQMSDIDGLVGQSHRAAQTMQKAGLQQPDQENVLISARSRTAGSGSADSGSTDPGTLDPALSGRAATDVAAAMRALPGPAGVASVAPPVRAKNGSALLVTVTLKKGTDSASPLLAATAKVQSKYPALRVEEVGAVSLDQAVNDQVGSDLSAAAKYSLPVTLLILLIAFGSIVAAGVPLLLALSAVGSATGLAALASHLIPDSGSTSSVILLMGMAVGVDYSLFYVKRVRAERQRGRTQLDAIEIAAETSGHSVVVSGISVVVSMLGLFLARYPVFSSIATGSIIVVAVAVLGSLTVLPAVLAKLGNHISPAGYARIGGRTHTRPRVPILRRWSMPDREPGGTSRSRGRLWSALLRPALHHPARTLVISVLAMGALAVPALGMHLQSDSVASLPRSIAEVHSYDRLTAAFPSQGTGHEIVVQAPVAEAADVHARLAALSARLDSNHLFVRGSGQLRRATHDTTTVQVLDVATPFDSESVQARASLTELRGTLVPDAVRGLAGVQWSVGGDTAQSVDVDAHLTAAIGWVIGFVVLLTMLVMGWVFRSVVIALSTAAVNLLSTGGAFGVLVLVFGHSWAEGLLGFTSTGRIINWIPLFTFAVLFGLSMDYHVFVLGHIREAAREGLATRDAVREGIVRSAGTVTSAAVVMVSVFAIFASLHMIEMKELGLSLAVAVLLDALVVRVIVLPSLMTLLGRWNWWPGRTPSGDRAQQHNPAEGPERRPMAQLTPGAR